jgi:predicted ATPase
MINQIQIKNYKSALDTTVPLTRFTVLIGENGAGKSNILEALVLAAAASSNKLDTEYLSARGVRLTEPRLMKSAFNSSTKQKPIQISIDSENLLDRKQIQSFKFILRYDDTASIRKWTLDPKSSFPTFEGNDPFAKILKQSEDSASKREVAFELRKLAEILENATNPKNQNVGKTEKRTFSVKINHPTVAKALGLFVGKFSFDRFTVYNASHETLRNHSATPPTSPIGPQGQGLLSELVNIQNQSPERFKDITESLNLLGWFNGINLPNTPKNSEKDPHQIGIQDRFIKSRGISVTEASVNEGFLFVLFYLTLVCSESTPAVFAIENIDTALNPKLVEALMLRLDVLSRKYNKQLIITTHNPAGLDALNLDDPEQSLLVVSRNPLGHTFARQYKKPLAAKGASTYKISEAFLKGHIGGLPKGI